MAISSQIQVQILIVLYSNICGLHADLEALSVAGSDYDVLVCADSKVSDLRHLSELLIPCFAPNRSEELHTWCPGYGTLC